MLPHRTTARKVFAITAGVVFGLTAAGVAVATRNSGGTYSLPAGNPVVTGTPITITWANTTLSDLGTEMTNSLSRDGYGGMRAALKGTDGTVAAPAFSFTNEAGTGIYRIGLSNPGLSVSGTKRQEWTTSGTTVNGTVKASDGLVAGPAYSFASEAGTGLYRIGASNPGLAVAGSKRQEWSTTGTTVTGTMAVTDDVTLTKAGAQTLTHSGGTLQVGTSDANEVEIVRSGTVVLATTSTSLDAKSRPIINVTDPSTAQGAATKNYVDVTAGASAATASALMRRDASSRVKIADPAAADDAATKGYVDSRIIRTGALTISGAGTTVTQAGLSEADTNYRVLVTCATSSGSPAAGAFTVVATNKGTSSFQLVISAAPGVGNSVTYDYVMFR